MSNPAQRVRDLSKRVLDGEDVKPETIREALSALREHRGLANEAKKASGSKSKAATDEELSKLLDL